MFGVQWWNQRNRPLNKSGQILIGAFKSDTVVIGHLPQGDQSERLENIGFAFRCTPNIPIRGYCFNFFPTLCGFIVNSYASVYFKSGIKKRNKKDKLYGQ